MTAPDVTCVGCGADVRAGTACGCRADDAQAALTGLALEVASSLAATDPDRLVALLAEDVRWGDDGAPNACRNRSEVIATFGRLLASGVRAEVAEVLVGPGGLVCHLRVEWAGAPDPERRAEVWHLYRVQDGLITEIVPFDDHGRAAAALAAGPSATDT